MGHGAWWREQRAPTFADRCAWSSLREASVGILGLPSRGAALDGAERRGKGGAWQWNLRKRADRFAFSCLRGQTHEPERSTVRGTIAAVGQGAVNVHMAQAVTKSLHVHAVAKALDGVTPPECPAAGLLGNPRRSRGTAHDALHGPRGDRMVLRHVRLRADATPRLVRLRQTTPGQAGKHRVGALPIAGFGLQ